MSWDGVRIYDKFGTEQAVEWLYQEFGEVVRHVGDRPGWALVEVRENDDIGLGLEGDHAIIEAPACIIVRVLDVFGDPGVGIAVAWYWPDAPLHTECNPGPCGFPPGMHTDRHDWPVGTTNLDGLWGGAMGGGAYYDPREAQGPHAVWLCGASDVVLGLGMIAGTNHKHLDLTFQWSTVGPPEPPEDPLERIEQMLASVHALTVDSFAAIEDVRRALAMGFKGLGTLLSD